MDKISQNIKKIESIIAKSKNLDEAPVKIVAVSKKKTSQDIQSAYDAGINNFGENYLQEALLKIQDLKQLDIIWHFIGSIQSNKCKEIAENFHWVHTIDRFKVASLLDKHCPENRLLKGLIQVNIDEEKSKSGVSLNDVKGLLAEINQLKKIKIIGLMIIPEITTAENIENNSFKRAQTLLYELKKDYPQLEELSMGMSRDFELAIKEGSTIVRLGETIFGARN